MKSPCPSKIATLIFAIESLIELREPGSYTTLLRSKSSINKHTIIITQTTLLKRKHNQCKKIHTVLTSFGPLLRVATLRLELIELNQFTIFFFSVQWIKKKTIPLAYSNVAHKKKTGINNIPSLYMSESTTNFKLMLTIINHELSRLTELDNLLFNLDSSIDITSLGLGLTRLIYPSLKFYN